MGEEKREQPDWITVPYLEKALQKGFNNPKLKIQKCDLSHATAVGDHYASIMLRARLSIQKSEKEEENLSIIIKIPPLGSFAEKTADLKPFGREIKMFTKTLPASNKILLKAFPNHEKFYAECYFGEEKTLQESIIILEDLRQSGFTLGDRFGGLDSDHTTLVLTSLAKLHASSLIYIENDPDPINLYDMYVWSHSNEEMCANIFKKGVGVIADVIKTWENEPKKDGYYRKMKALEEVAVEKLINVFAKDDTKLNVICHGDCWINNMMFRYDNNNKVNGIKFLDFQISHYNTPALDLNYFIFTSAKSRFTNVDQLLEIYYETFMETIKKMNYKLKKPFTLQILKEEFREKLFYGLLTILCIFPITMADPADAPKLDDMLGDEKKEDGTRVYRSKKFSEILKVALPFFEKHGVF
jgi:hypothetical protein